MKTSHAALAVALTALVLGTPVLEAQDSLTFQIDFETGQKFDYEMTGTSTARMDDGQEQTTRIQASYGYEIVSVSGDEFTILSRIQSFRVETPEETLEFGPGASDTPLYLTAIVEAVNSIRVTYDSKWNVVRVRGFGHFVERMLDRAGDVPGRLGDVLSPIVETILGPIATAIARDTGSEEFPGRLFQAGTVRQGDEWSSLEDVQFIATVRRTWKVESIGAEKGRRVANTTATTEVEYQGLFDVLGYRTQNTESRTSFMADGLPVSSRTTAEVVMARPAGMRVTTQLETALTTPGLGMGPGAAKSDLATLRRTADEARKSGDVDALIDTLKSVVEAEPKNGQNWFELAQAIEAKAMRTSSMDPEPGTTPEVAKLFIAAGTALRRYEELDPAAAAKNRDTASYIYYNEACGYAVTGKTDKALESLNLSVTFGFHDADHIQADPDLTSLRDEPRYKAILDSIPALIQQAAVDGAKAILESGETFPFTYDLTDVTGKQRRLSDLEGKIVIVDFWGTWCPPCRREIPHFIDLHERYNAKGLEIVGLTYEGLDDAEAKTKVQAYAKEHGIPYTLIIGDEKTQKQVPEFRGYPTTLFIDRTGKVRARLTGYRDLQTLEAIVNLLLEEETD